MNDQRSPMGAFRLVILLLSGFLISQILSTVHIFFSNAAFYDKLLAVHHAGYLAVPNMQVVQHLKDWSSAFNGGLFFSLTSGFALSIFSIFAAWIWYDLLKKKKAALIILALLWAASIMMVNQNGFSSLITTYLVCIPCTIFPFFGKLFSFNSQNSTRLSFFFHVLLFVLFSIGCATQINVEKFLDIRDYLFLGNPTGKKLNAFYYDNSLYSANYFKSFSQKLIKTSDLETIQNKQLKKQIRLFLNRSDYLSLEAPAQADLKITIQHDTIHLYHKNSVILSIPVQDFFHSPQQYINRFESKTDRHAMFRMITMISLLFAGTILLYAMTFLLPFSLLKQFITPIWATMIAGLICILILFILFYGGNSNEIGNPENISAALESHDSVLRIKVLRYLVDQKKDISAFPEIETLAAHGTIPERYWIAKAIAQSRKPSIRDTLLRLLEDDHFNVVCMALYSMGKQGRKADIPIILQKIKTSDNWYVQWYAYKALRNLGWHQKIIN